MSQKAEPGPASPLASPDPWNLVVDGYEEIIRPFIAQFSRTGLAMLRYGPESRAIDVACGPGTTTLLLSPLVKRVACVDFSARMLTQLRRNAAAAGAANLDVIEGDGQALPFEDGSFDLGVSMFGLMFFPDRGKGFAELKRVLVSGGQVLVSSWLPVEKSPLMREQVALVAALKPDDAPSQPPQRLSALEDRDVFEAEMRAAGFVDVRIEAATHDMEVNDVEQFLGRHCPRRGADRDDEARFDHRGVVEDRGPRVEPSQAFAGKTLAHEAFVYRLAGDRPQALISWATSRNAQNQRPTDLSHSPATERRWR